MALNHQFIIVDKDSRINYIEDWMDKIEISDNLILYIKDSFEWIETTGIRASSKKTGLDYYGYTIIKTEGIEKLHKILVCWRSLFEKAPEEFILTGNFMPEENTYERNCYIRKEVIKQLKELEVMCNEALTKEAYILHNGI